MTYTRSEWSISLLRAIGNLQPTPNVVDWVVAWTILESVPGRAAYNLLNTTHGDKNSTSFNSVGVQNFACYSDAIYCNRNALQDGFYPTLLKALQINDETALGFVSGGSITASILTELSIWCGHCNYGNQLLSLIGDSREHDLFEGQIQWVGYPQWEI